MKVSDPAMKPAKANQEIFFRYQKKSSIHSMATTPAADPIMSIPSCPRRKGYKCQSGSSIISENIPILAATNGTLSIIADPIPNSITTMSELGIAV